MCSKDFFYQQESFGSQRDPFIFWFKVSLCCLSWCVCPADNSLIVIAAYRSFLASAVQVRAIICLHSCYETTYLTGEGQTQNRILPYGVTSLWRGNSSKSLVYLAALWFFTVTPPLAIFLLKVGGWLVGGTGKFKWSLHTHYTVHGWLALCSIKSGINWPTSFIRLQPGTVCNVAWLLHFFPGGLAFEKCLAARILCCHQKAWQCAHTGLYTDRI